MRSSKMLALAFLTSGLLPGAAFAAKTYQVTGPVLEVTADHITVETGAEKWQIARDASTKMSAEPNVGEKVTIEYAMTATSIEVKPAAAPKAPAKTTGHAATHASTHKTTTPAK